MSDRSRFAKMTLGTAVGMAVLRLLTRRGRAGTKPVIAPILVERPAPPVETEVRQLVLVPTPTAASTPVQPMVWRSNSDVRLRRCRRR